MPEKDPTNWSIATWMLALGMALAGGLVNWYSRFKQDHARTISVVELVGETFTSGFVGVATFMLLEGLHYDISICAAASGVAGHMAARLLFKLEHALERKIDQAFEDKK